ADLADVPAADPGVAHAFLDVPHHLFAELVLGAAVHVRRVRQVDVVAGAHADVQPGGGRDAPQSQRVPPQAPGGAVHDRAAAGVGDVAAHRGGEALEVAAPGEAGGEAVGEDRRGVVLQDALYLLVDAATLLEVLLDPPLLQELVDLRVGVVPAAQRPGGALG